MAEPSAVEGAEPGVDPRVATPPLRVGVLLPDGPVPRWVLTAVEAIRSSSDADVVVVVRSSTLSAKESLGSGPSDAPGTAMRLLLASYHRVDGGVFGRRGDPTEDADSGAILAGILSLEVTLRDSPESIAERLREHELDVLVRFARPDLDGVADRIARHGVWSHRPSGTSEQGSQTPALPVGLAEVLRGSVVTLGALDVSRGADELETIAWTVSATDRISVLRGMRGHLAKVAQLARHALRDLRRDGRLPAPPPPGVTTTSAGLFSTLLLAELLMRLALGYFSRLIQRTIAPNRWIVAVTHTIEGASLPDPARTGVHHLVPPTGRAWADPFLVRFDGRTLLFVEEWVDRERRGRIALVRLDEALRPSEPETVLAVEGHLSYPQIFAWRDTWYLLPEQAERGGLELYRAKSFPTEWTHDRTLIADPPLSDATIAKIDGRWWLFAAVTPSGGTAADELVLFSADQPIGPWRPHPRNPVLSDIRSARPAGRLIRRDGQWYRPSQDCSAGYGSALNLNRIDRLDDGGYRESLVARLQPNWRKDLVGTHTLSEAHGLTAIDLWVRWPKVGRGPLKTD